MFSQMLDGVEGWVGAKGVRAVLEAQWKEKEEMDEYGFW